MHQPTPAVAAVAELMQRYGRGALAITGAGCSTESGIPDYRSPSGVYRRADFKPLTYQRFRDSEMERQRYWARSMLGYTTMSNALPNAAHFALHNLTNIGWLRSIVTQNVDGLHHVAANGGRGARSDSPLDEDSQLYISSIAALTELHGNIHTVACSQCKAKIPRRRYQRELQLANAELLEKFYKDRSLVMPDGDFVVPDDAVKSMQVVHCAACGGWLRPDVVLFGENVRGDVVAHVHNTLSQCGLLLCCGTSLQVYSSFRFVEAAKLANIPIVIVNHGATRGDQLATLKVDEASVASFLANLEKALASSS